MQAIARPALGTMQAAAVSAPRIKPVHDPVDRPHSDLVFSVQTGGRPFRILLARERSLFGAGEAGARNASNFYDSQREGLQHDDGPPCFYYRRMSTTATVLHNVPPGTGNPRGQTGSIYAMGRRISGSHAYGSGIYRERVLALLHGFLTL